MFKLSDYQTESGHSLTPVYVPGNGTVHIGRKIGTYESGRPRYRRMCSGNGRANHEPSRLAMDTPINCKRCLAKLPADARRQAETAVAATPMPSQSVADLERLENLIGVCIRDYKYATKIKDAARATEALKGLAEYSAELATLAS